MKRATGTVPMAIWMTLALAAGPILSPATQAAADSSFLCENNARVRMGEHIHKVVTDCGEPDWAAQRVEKHKIKVKTGRRLAGTEEEITEERVIEILVDDLMYDFGMSRKARYLRFENGFLRGIYSQWQPPPP
jgi:hypothetical protein